MEDVSTVDCTVHHITILATNSWVARLACKSSGSNQAPAVCSRRMKRKTHSHLTPSVTECTMYTATDLRITFFPDVSFIARPVTLLDLIPLQAFSKVKVNSTPRYTHTHTHTHTASKRVYICQCPAPLVVSGRYDAGGNPGKTYSFGSKERVGDFLKPSVS